MDGLRGGGEGPTFCPETTEASELEIGSMRATVNGVPANIWGGDREIVIVRNDVGKKREGGLPDLMRRISQGIKELFR